MFATAWPFIELNEAGVALIQGTQTKVTEIVACHLAYSWDAEQIHRQLTGLSLPQIHAALGYYYEYKTDVDLLPERSRETAEGLRRRVEDLSLMQLAKAETSATVSD